MTTIRHVLSLEAKASDVRAALTTPAGIRGWWAKDADISEGEGADHELRFEKEGRHVVMKFSVEADRPDQIRWRCTGNDNPIWPGTTLTWHLTSDGARTNLVFEHSGFAEAQSPPYRMTVDGWEHFVESLRAYTESGRGQPW